MSTNKHINPGVSDLFFNHDTVCYTALWNTDDRNKPISKDTIRKAVHTDAVQFLTILESAFGPQDFTADDLTEDFIARV